ncbi:MAG: two component system response regulator [Naasia sp.]|nr:two component system response regulator [Naasia sp.]
MSEGLRVVVADDDSFTVSLVAGGLRGQGFEVHGATTVAEALSLVDTTDPHVLVSDLDFGHGESGAALLREVHRDYPWIGLVVLSAHRAPQLAVDDLGGLPPGAVYLVKSALRQVEDLADAVRGAIAGTGWNAGEADPDTDIVALTSAQADVLRMLAGGASTKALAAHRGTTVRAAETMLTRLYAALGLEQSDSSNTRVEAVRLWQQGRVTVR